MEEIEREILGLNEITPDLIAYVRKVKQILEGPRRKPRKKKISSFVLNEIENKLRIAFGYGGLLLKALSMESFTIRELSFHARTDESIVRKWIEEATSEGLLRQEGNKYVIDRKRAKEFLEEIGYAIIDFATRV